MTDEDLAQLQREVYGAADRPLSHLRTLPSHLALLAPALGGWATIRRWPLELARFLPGDAGIAIVRQTATGEFVPAVLSMSGTVTGQLLVLVDGHGAPVQCASAVDAQAMIETRLRQGARRRRKPSTLPASAVHGLLPPGRGFDWRMLTPYAENVMFPHRKPKPSARPIEPALVEPILHGMSLENGLRFAACIHEIDEHAAMCWFREDPRRFDLFVAEAERERLALLDLSLARMRALFEPEEQVEALGALLSPPTSASAVPRLRQDTPPAVAARARVMLVEAAARLIKHGHATCADCARIVGDVIAPASLPSVVRMIEEANPDGWLDGTRTSPPTEHELRLITAELVDRELDRHPWLWAELEGIWRAIMNGARHLSLDGVAEAFIQERIAGTAPADLKGLLESWAYGMALPLDLDGAATDPLTGLRLAGCRVRRH